MLALAQLAAGLALILLNSAASSSSPAPAKPNWLLDQPGADLERESAPPPIGPLQIGHAVRQTSQLFRDGRLQPELVANERQWQQVGDMFNCVEPTRGLYDNFIRQYNRTFGGDPTDKLERLNLFALTLKRAILFNRIIQNEILNATNYQLKHEIRNYHFVEPTTTSGARDTPTSASASSSLAIWYVDITDCELGLIKYILFEIFYLIDKSHYETAYKTATDNSQYLPLLNDDGLEQLANVLLLRLYDRFKGDDKMNQLFQWPNYLKKLAGYAYSRQQTNRPDFKAKLSLITFAYPAYFKDLKYNWPAVNRTADNIKANGEHKKFSTALNRRFANLQEKNKRLAIFRQRWSLINQLNKDESNGMNILSIQPDWLRVHSNAHDHSAGHSGKLVDDESSLALINNNNNRARREFNLTQFSDLTDTEFVAFLSNDFSLLNDNKESIIFLEQNFPVRTLDTEFKDEIALELELRRSTLANSNDDNPQPPRQVTDLRARTRPGLVLARQVVDELISDVGLPIGPVALDNIKEEEHFNVFNKLTEFFRKPYALGLAPSARLVAPPAGATLTESDLADERQRRYEQFKANHARFRAWFIKEGWQSPNGPLLDEAQTVAMLRLADMSWLEIKLTLFKVCCLSQDNLASLSSANATIQYLGSNEELLCQPMDKVDDLGTTGGAPLRQEQALERELAALELYYYYSVHFNKHHSNMNEFERRFAIFRRNIDSIRRHSCKRSLTLYESLRSGQLETLSSIDVLDPRRSFTDDLNLDRYHYFQLEPRKPDADSWTQRASDLVALSPGHQEGPLVSRAGGISYRRTPFASLLSRPGQQQSSTNRPNASHHHQPARSDKLLYELNEPVNELAAKYARNNAHKVYELVMQRYRYCMKTVRNVDLDLGDLRQQCQSSGKYADLSAASAFASYMSPELAASRPARVTQEEQNCEFYRQGLESWAEGLIQQGTLSARLIQEARC